MAKKIDENNVIFQARARLKISTEELGAAIGRTGRLISMIEMGKCSASRYVVEAVRQLLIERGMEAEPYSDDELALTRDYRMLSPDNKAAARAVIRGMAGATNGGTQ